MIKVKKTRSDTDRTDPSQPYGFDDGAPKGGLPQAIAMAILSVAFYLRSMVSGHTEAVRPQTDAVPDQPRSASPQDPQGGAGPAEAAADAAPAQAPFVDPDASAFIATLSISTGRNVVSLFSNTVALDRATPGALHGDAVPQAAAPQNIWDSLTPHTGGIHRGDGITGSGWPDAPRPAPAPQPPGIQTPDTQTPGTQTPGAQHPHAQTPDPRDPVTGTETPPDTPSVRPNRAPVRLRSVTLDDILGTGAILIGTAHLLEHVSDPDGDVLQVVDITASAGTLTPVAGGFLYTPDPGYAGVVQLAYQISDGQAAVAQMAHLNIRPVSQNGTDAADVLIGTDGADVIAGGDGDDQIAAQGSDDVIFGGDGADRILGGAGDDLIYGGAGDDILFGEAGRDRIDGGAGHDMIYGGEGSDVLDGGSGNDAVFGGNGDDVMDGGTGDDVLSDGAGSDIVIGGAGSDIIRAAADGADDLYQGDALAAGPDTGAVDTLDFSAVTAALSIDMTEGTADSTDSGHDSFAGFEVVIAGSGDDVILGSAADETVVDGAGRDTVMLAGGDDRIVVTQDTSADTFDGGAGQDTLDLSQIETPVVTDLSAGRVATATGPADSFSGFEVIIGTKGDDRFIIGDGAVTLTGGAGDDLYCFDQVDGITQNTATITDFGIGDVIETRIWRFFEDDGRDDHGGLRLDGGDRPDALRPLNVNFRYETGADGDTTRIDIHEDDMFDAFITLTGHHVLILHDAL